MKLFVCLRMNDHDSIHEPMIKSFERFIKVFLEPNVIFNNNLSIDNLLRVVNESYSIIQLKLQTVKLTYSIVSQYDVSFQSVSSQADRS